MKYYNKMNSNKLMNNKRDQPAAAAISASAMGRALLLLHLASSSASAFTSTPPQQPMALASCSSALQYRTGNNEDAAAPVGMQFFNTINKSSTNRNTDRHQEVNKWRDDSRRSMILVQMTDSVSVGTRTPAPTSQPTMEIQEMDEYIEYLDRRYNRMHSKRQPSQHKHTLKLLGLTSLASDRLRQRLHVVPSSKTNAVASSSSVGATTGILANRPTSPTSLVIVSSPAAAVALKLKLITDKFVTSLRPWLLVERSSGFSIASLAMVMLVQPLLRGIIFRQG